MNNKDNNNNNNNNNNKIVKILKNKIKIIISNIINIKI